MYRDPSFLPNPCVDLEAMPTFIRRFNSNFVAFKTINLSGQSASSQNQLTAGPSLNSLSLPHYK